MRQDIFVIEADYCIGCKACHVACKMNNDVPLGADRTRVKQVGPHGTYPDIQMYFLPSRCQQCENPACVSVCPTGACYKRQEDGVVVIDQTICMGCRSCQRACPYEANTYNSELNVMDKCDTCLSRRQDGKLPYCVQNCPGECLHVGDINDPDSDVAKLLSQADPATVHTLPDSGNHPAVKYILKNDTWQEVLPQECQDTKRGKKS